MSTPLDEWRALGPGARRVAWKNARDFRAHPDPVVSAAAARYARWYLDARTWPARTRRLAIGLVMADATVAAGVLVWLSGGPVADRPGALDKVLICLVAVVIALAVLVPLAVRRTRLIRVYRLELASRPALEGVAVASGAGARAPAAGLAPERGIRVGVARRVVRLAVRGCALVVLLGCLMPVVLVGQWRADPGMTPVFGALCGLYAVFLLLFVPPVVLLARRVLPRRPVIELDAEGVHMPSLACDLPWALLAEVRLVTMRYARRGSQQAMVVAFVPRDPAALLGAIPGGRRRRRRLERSTRVYGTPLSVCDNMIDHSGEQIAAAVTAFTTVPVRRQ